jgi:protein phosphatase
VTRALGIERQVALEMHEHNALPGDLFLLCSDGLSEMVPDRQLFTVLLQDIDLSRKATLLVSLANDNGGKDNVSVVLARAAGDAAAGAVQVQS